jgi:hypothetical protein
VIARAAPAHVMVLTEGPIQGVMLEIATEDKGLAAEPDGYIHVIWPRVEALQMPESQEWTRHIIGWVGLVAFVALFIALALFARPKPARSDAT